MIPFKTILGNFEIPSSFEDLIYEDLDYLRNNKDNPLKVFSKITGLEEEKCSILNLDPIIPHLDFLDQNVLESIDPIKDLRINGKLYHLPEDITLLSWGQKLISSDALAESRFLECLSVYLQPIYFEEKFNAEDLEKMEKILRSCDVATVYGGLKFIAEQLKNISEREANLLKSEVTHEQKLAGIENFNQLGHFNTIDMIAGGDVLKYETVLALDYNTIFNKLFLSNLTTKFERKYSEIMKPKQAPKNKNRRG